MFLHPSGMDLDYDQLREVRTRFTNCMHVSIHITIDIANIKEDLGIGHFHKEKNSRILK